MATLKTLFLRVPIGEWPQISQGYKTELRVPSMGAVRSSYFTPTPVVLYAPVGFPAPRREKLAVLLEHRTERLLDVAENPESLMRENQPSYDHFRAYWRNRTHRPYRPLQEVEVFRIGAWCDEPVEQRRLGLHLLRRLYGDFIPS